MTFLKKIKTVIEACCGKLDVLEAEVHKQNTRITNLQQEIEEIKATQNSSTILLEEILFAVSQSNSPDDSRQDVLNSVHTKVLYDVN